MKNHSNLFAFLGLGAALLMAAPAMTHAQTTAVTTDDDAKAPIPPTADQQKRIRELMAANVPVWDSRVLTAYETASPWEDNLNYQYLEKLLGETPFDWEGKSQPPSDAERLMDSSKTMRIRRADGAFRYHSNKRVFTPDLKGKQAPSYDLVTRQMFGFLNNLRFPMVEADRADVQNQEVALSNTDGKVGEKFPTYAFFLMQRKIDGLPVEGSTVRAAVNLRGEVQRVKIAWPHFRVRPGAQLRSRDRVLEEAIQKVFSQSPTDKLQLASRLVYAKSEKGDFLPAVQVDVSDGLTPYRLTIPVAQ